MTSLLLLALWTLHLAHWTKTCLILTKAFLVPVLSSAVSGLESQRPTVGPEAFVSFSLFRVQAPFWVILETDVFFFF